QEEVSNNFEKLQPWAQVYLRNMIDVVENATKSNEDARIKYANLLAVLNNVEKNYRGGIDGARRMELVAMRGEENSEFQTWLSTAERKAKYGDVLAELRALVDRETVSARRAKLLRFLGIGAWMESTGRTLYRWAKEREKPDAERQRGFQERDVVRATERLKAMDRRYDPSVEPALMAFALGEYSKLPADARIPAWDKAFGISKAAYNSDAVARRVSAMIKKSKLGDLKNRLALFEKSAQELEASKDPFIQLAVASYEREIELEEAAKARAGESIDVRGRYMAALLEFNEERGRPIYADANSTLRISFGSVLGSMPKDGLRYDAFTTIDGLAAKHTGEVPFDSPETQLELIRKGDHGPFYHRLYQSVPVNFLCTLDITGGNSGSPILNARGDLVGLAFDGTYEGIISDWAFDRSNSRTIAVDVRYMLWVMSKVDGAYRLLEEMGVADFKPRAARRAGRH
ncbi:MAG: S46 family peptidase, partial [Myxococcota bacterium]